MDKFDELPRVTFWQKLRRWLRPSDTTWTYTQTGVNMEKYRVGDRVKIKAGSLPYLGTEVQVAGVEADGLILKGDACYWPCGEGHRTPFSAIVEILAPKLAKGDRVRTRGKGHEGEVVRSGMPGGREDQACVKFNDRQRWYGAERLIRLPGSMLTDVAADELWTNATTVSLPKNVRLEQQTAALRALGIPAELDEEISSVTMGMGSYTVRRFLMPKRVDAKTGEVPFVETTVNRETPDEQQKRESTEAQLAERKAREPWRLTRADFKATAKALGVEDIFNDIEYITMSPTEVTIQRRFKNGGRATHYIPIRDTK